MVYIWDMTHGEKNRKQKDAPLENVKSKDSTFSSWLVYILNMCPPLLLLL
jgi:hypothetical protein